MGGGNGRGLPQLDKCPGLSPRGRGKRTSSSASRRNWGSIPAWAGETITPYSARGSAAVYPRVGGGNTLWQRRLPAACGLSPRGRGKPPVHRQHGRRLGSIPAWAGETLGDPNAKCMLLVYPRVGGGNAAQLLRGQDTGGLSPRGRGKRSNRRLTQSL